MKYLSLFSGIEAATVAWEPLGWEPVAFCEIDDFPSAVLAYRFPDVPNLGDITKVDWSVYSGTVDVIVGGSPCQSFSLAGGRDGLQGESGLMFEYIRAVREIMPRFFIWENVCGALSCEKGEAFRQLLSEMDDIGYGMAWRVLDSEFFGVAQRRRRVFLVGCLGSPECAAEILFESEMLRWDYPTNREKREELTRTIKLCASESGGANHLNQSDVFVIDRAAFNQGINAAYSPHIEKTDVMDTLVAKGAHAVMCMASGQVNAEIEINMTPTQSARQYKDPQIITDGYVVRRLTPRECERLQGFPDDWTLVPYNGKLAADTPRYKALGNSMPVPVMRWIGNRIDKQYNDNKND